jgi:nicotinate-nucleotide adenylyltransferase
MLGIYGGTFDPVHYGHLRTALEVEQALQLEELRFLPCRIPPHRAEPAASPMQRLHMLELALANAEPGFSVDRSELDRLGPSYMVDTLSKLRTITGDTPLVLILGLDAFCGLPTWHRWRELFELAHIAVMRRPDAMEPEWVDELAQIVLERKAETADQLRSELCGKLIFFSVTQLAISATLIRKLTAQGKSARYLLPDAVIAFIEEQGLYRLPSA